jgi:ribosome-binding protein aMBF1 (putative translation factor)
MDILDICEIDGCTSPAERITSTETKIIQVCRDCYSKKYKK